MKFFKNKKGFTPLNKVANEMDGLNQEAVGGLKPLTIDSHLTGFTLLEITVAMGMFIVTMLIVMGIFRSIIEGQRSALASQNTQESIRFAFEIMGKEIRMAKFMDVGCRSVLGITNTSLYPNIIYNSSTTKNNLIFKNKDDSCVKYYIENNRIKIFRYDLSATVDSFIIPDEIMVSNVQFEIVDFTSFSNKIQPKVTMKMDVESKVGGQKHKNKITVQTTISSRNYNEN